MIDPKSASQTIRSEFSGAFGVPDSLLKGLNSAFDDFESTFHQITANEGAAVGMAVGAFLATGKPALVYMQNSGLGNALNPLVSLASKEVYGVPLVLLVGWRGEPGGSDEPQHKLQGSRTVDILEAIQIPWEVAAASTEEFTKQLERMKQLSVSSSNPTALLIRAGSFSSHSQVPEPSMDVSHEVMSRERAVEIVANFDPTGYFFATTGMLARELYEIRENHGDPHSRDFLVIGGMGHVAAIAHGFARLKNKGAVYCLDGDGSMLMHMGSSAVLASETQAKITHIVFNNRCHDSVGGQPTPTRKLDLAKVASTFGYSESYKVSTPDELEDALAESRAARGATFIEIAIRPGARDGLGRPKSAPSQMIRDFLEAQV